ncbi:hypothetical protein OG625_25275 [Streptomyces sp. NBC_01351]|uniref:hypothetical protein n=1 Tax=Streptomyces sp. NBC_01351 TaxID=2903833 RepID=UPI002E34B467|nr:hypothetical protein [Streptomyces sp. NBC_01351]
MRRVLATALLTLVASAAGTVTATAQGEHFIGAITCTKSLSSGLTCAGKAAGLGNRATSAFLSAESVQAEYICVNRGGNTAPGQGTEFNVVVGPSRNFNPRNGQITFTNVNLPIPDAPSSRDVCPNGNWTVNLTRVFYEDVVLHIQQNGTDILFKELGDIAIPPEGTVVF